MYPFLKTVKLEETTHWAILPP